VVVEVVVEEDLAVEEVVVVVLAQGLELHHSFRIFLAKPKTMKNLRVYLRR
jgi:hypothetical protein